MKTYQDFFPLVYPDVPGVTPDMATQAIQNTIIEFCEKSLIHQVTLDPLTLVEGLDTYDLEPDGDVRVTKIMRAWFRGTELTALAPDDIERPDPYNTIIGDYRPDKAEPKGYTQRDEYDTITFTPIPNQRYQNAITMRVALVPLRSATQIADFLLETWGEIISFGAKARLQVNPGKPYTNVDAAQINQARFTVGLNDARQRAVRGNVRSTLSVQMRKV